MGEIMKKTTIMNLVVAGFVGVAAAGLVGCADTETTAYNPPVEVVHEPTALDTVPPTTTSTTRTTQFSNGTVEKQTTTDYNPGYTTVGPPYKTTVVAAPAVTTVVPAPSVVTVEPAPAITVVPAPAVTTTRTTTTVTDE
jgi:ABC-type oligopeptide transport system substrate-binding subunit